MNWASVVKKEVNIQIEKKEIIEVIEEPKVVKIMEGILDFDEEFELEYMNDLREVKIDFEDLMDTLGFPFMNWRSYIDNYENTFYEYIKKYLVEAETIRKRVQINNDEVNQQYEDENDNWDDVVNYKRKVEE